MGEKIPPVFYTQRGKRRYDFFKGYDDNKNTLR